MAIKKSFSGITVRKPGAYSRSIVSPDAGSALVGANTMLIIGEADAGEGGASEGIVAFSAQGFNALKAKYRSGPLVDVAKAALTPSRTPGVNGAQQFLIYKTNASSQASLALANSFGILKAKEFGIGGNRITYKNTLGVEGEIAVTSSAAITNFVGLNTQTLKLRKNGGSLLTVTFAAPANMTDVLSQINAVINPQQMTASQPSAGILKISLDGVANSHRLGYGRVMEIDSASSSLANLNITVGVKSALSEPQASIELTQPRDGITEANSIGGSIILKVGRDDSDSCTAANISVTSSQISLVATGSVSYNLLFVDYPILSNMVDAINNLPGFSASLGQASFKTMACSELDEVATLGCFSPNGNEVAHLKADAQAMINLIADSDLVILESPIQKGLPDAEGRFNLAGGAKGASASSAFDAGFSAALGQECNVIVPAISQDASVDLLSGLTEAASTYDIETVIAMLDSHLRLRSNIKNRKEAMGMCGYRKQAKLDVFNQAANMGSELLQLAMQDVLVVDAGSNELAWKQPHVFAAMLAGMRLGTEIGEPLTHKYLNCSGVGHFVNSATGKVNGDFDALIDFDEAIDAGVTFSEPVNGSHRIVIDNTTYGADDSFVFNRGSVMEASQYIAKTVRSDAEIAFVGKKNSVITAEGIKSRVRTKLDDLFRARILAPSDDAPKGYLEESFIVVVSGNTADVQVEVKPVQGLDFIFITFTLGDVKQTA